MYVEGTLYVEIDLNSEISNSTDQIKCKSGQWDNMKFNGLEIETKNSDYAVSKLVLLLDSTFLTL